MITPGVSDRYPRRGERLAPATLREFLMDPVPGPLHQGSTDPDLMLCDLDETAWKRFPHGALVELAKLVIARAAKCQGRRGFRARPFPRPAAGLELDDLRLEGRTWRCLVRAGYDQNLQALGDLSLGQIVAIRSFGPRCLVDLLVAVESAGVDRAKREVAVPQETALSGQLTAAARRLAAMPEAEAVRREDPRFAGPMHAVDVEAKTAAELAERLVARRRDPPDAAYAAEQIEQLCRRVERAAKFTLEEELIDVFASGTSERNRRMLAGYYGWEDGRRHTLGEIGGRFGVSRERVRQICAKLTMSPGDVGCVLAPATERVLSLIGRRLPRPAAEIEAELAAEGLTRTGMSLKRVAEGAGLLRRAVPFRIVKIDGRNLAVAPGDADAAMTVADSARKEACFYGLATVERIHRRAARTLGGSVHAKLLRRTLRLLDGFEWLDESAGWFWLGPIAGHGLPKTVDKILSVAGSIRVAEMRAAIARNRRAGKTPPPENVLLEYCRAMPGVRVEGQRIIADPPPDWREALAGVERTLVEVLREEGPIMEREAMLDGCVARGVNPVTFHAVVSWSPRAGPGEFPAGCSRATGKPRTARSGWPISCRRRPAAMRW